MEKKNDDNDDYDDTIMLYAFVLPPLHHHHNELIQVRYNGESNVPIHVESVRALLKL